MSYKELQLLADETSLLLEALKDFADFADVADVAALPPEVRAAWPFGEKSPAEAVAATKSFLASIEVAEAREVA